MASTLNGYSLRHVIGHLLNRGRVDDACKMLFTTVGGENVLFEAQGRAGDWSGLLNDLSATAAALASEASPRPALELKLALLRSTVQNIVSSYPVAAVGARLRTGTWGRDEAIRFARALANPLRRADALMTVAEATPNNDNFEILRSALAALQGPQGAALGEDGGGRREGLRRLIALMPEEARNEIVAEMIGCGLRQTLIDVLSLIPERDIASVVRAGLEMTRAIAPDTAEGRTLFGEAMLTEGETGKIEQQLAAVKADSAAAFSVRAPNREDIFKEALTYADQTQGTLRLQTRARLCRSAPDAVKALLTGEVLDEGLTSDRGLRILARELAADLPEAGLRRMLEKARQLGDLNIRVTEICRTARHLPAPEWRAIAGELVADLESGWGTDGQKIPFFAAKTLAANGAVLAGEQVRRLIALFERDPRRDGDLLLALLKGTSGRSEEIVEAALRHVKELSKGFDDDQAYLRILRDLMGSEGLHYINQVVQAGESDKTFAAKLMTGCDASLQPSLLPLTEAVARRMRDPVSQIAALCAIAAQIQPESERRESVKSACELADRLASPDTKLMAGVHLVRVAGREWRERFFKELSDKEAEDGFRTWPTEVLQQVLPYVDPEMRVRWAERAAIVVRELAAPDQNERKLRTVAPHWISLTAWLPEGDREFVEQTILSEMNLETEVESEIDTLAAMLPYLTAPKRADLAQRIFKNTRALQGPNRGLVILNMLKALPANGSESLPYTVRSVALYFMREALKINCDMCQRNVLGAATVFFDDLPFEVAVETVSNIDLDWILYPALRELVGRRLHTLTAADVLGAWRRLLKKADKTRRSRFLIWVTEMAPTLPLLGGQDVLEQAWRGIAAVGICWP